jgi:hypothetical protein
VRGRGQDSGRMGEANFPTWMMVYIMEYISKDDIYIV